MNFKLPDLLAFLKGKGVDVVANETTGEFEVKEPTPPAGPPVQNQTNVPILNADEIQALRDLADLVPELGKIQAFMNQQQAQAEAERNTLIASIKANAANPYSDEELKAMQVPALVKLNGLMNVNYAPMGGSDVFQNSDEVLTLPSALTSYVPAKE